MENSKKHEPAFPIGVKNDWNEYYQTGMTLRDYFANNCKNDFDNLPIYVKEEIVGEEAPKYIDKGLVKIRENMQYYLWIAKGRAKWKYIQADELIKQREL